MKRFFLPIALVLLCAVAAAAPEGGIKGVIVNRAGREALSGASLSLSRGETQIGNVKTDADGSFDFSGVEDGSYRIEVEADGFLPTSIFVIVENGMVRDLMTVSLTPESAVDVDDDSYAEFDMNDSGYSDTPTLLTGNNDPFTAVASYGFSALRYKSRGYNSETQDVYLAGVKMNDAITGYSPYSLWSGMNEATRSQDNTSGLQWSDVAVGGFNGITNIYANPSSVRKGWRFSVLTNSALYRLRFMGSYASGPLDNGWSYAFNVSARIGGNDWVKGVYYRSFAYYAGVEKKISDEHAVTLVTFASPGQRGAQNSSTQEVYDLMGDNMYNSNWGYQNGKVRNARIRKTFEPVTFVKYNYTPSDNLEASATLLWRTGKNGYTALDWFNAADPRPDYYRNLPSYFYDEMDGDDTGKSAFRKAGYAADQWMRQLPDIVHINWSRMYNINYNSYDKYSPTERRSHYVQEERHVDQNDFNLALQAKWRPDSRFVFVGGVNGKLNNTENYKKLADLLGGDYYVNIDNFAERDYAMTPYKLQQDLNYYVAHGKTPQILRTGDKYGYDYMAKIRKIEAWANGGLVLGNFTANLALAAGYTHYWREGLYRKGLFAGYAPGSTSMPYMLDGVDIAARDSYGNIITSFGNSENDGTNLFNGSKGKFFTYRVKAGVGYALRGGHSFALNAGYFNDAPTFNQAFISPRTRNTMIPHITTVKTFGTDLSYRYSANGYNIGVTAYYSTIKDQTDVMSFYDDAQTSFTNLALWGMDERHLGIELGFSIPLPLDGLTLKGALAWGNHVYTSNPHMTQTVDNSAETIYEDVEISYWKATPTKFKTLSDGTYEKDVNGNLIALESQAHHIPGSPELATSLSLNYRTKSYWFFTLEGQYFADSYLDMNPLYRTTAACSGPDGKHLTPDSIKKLTTQEKFAPAFLLNASVGKSWYLKYKYNFGFSLSANNLTNNRDVRIGGYEQTRLVKGAESYKPFPAKYFYMPGFNYMLNLYFRF